MDEQVGAWVGERAGGSAKRVSTLKRINEVPFSVALK